MTHKTLSKCPYCDGPMENVCSKCGAYRVTKETHDLPLSGQPYYNPEIHKKFKKKKMKPVLDECMKLISDPIGYIPPAPYCI